MHVYIHIRMYTCAYTIMYKYTIKDEIFKRKLSWFVGLTHNVGKLSRFDTENKLQCPSCGSKQHLGLNISGENFHGLLKSTKTWESFLLWNFCYLYVLMTPARVSVTELTDTCTVPIKL